MEDVLPLDKLLVQIPFPPLLGSPAQEQLGFDLQLAVDVVQVLGGLDVGAAQLTETEESVGVSSLSDEEPRRLGAEKHQDEEYEGWNGGAA